MPTIIFPSRSRNKENLGLLLLLHSFLVCASFINCCRLDLAQPNFSPQLLLLPSSRKQICPGCRKISMHYSDGIVIASQQVQHNCVWYPTQLSQGPRSWLAIQLQLQLQRDISVHFWEAFFSPTCLLLQYVDYTNLNFTPASGLILELPNFFLRPVQFNALAASFFRKSSRKGRLTD